MRHLNLLLLLGAFSSTVYADFTVVSWNAKHLGRKNQDLASAAQLLIEGDIIAVQEVNSSESGKNALSSLTITLQKLTNSHYCFAYSEIPTDAKERYALIWKQDLINYVTTKGEVLATCPKVAITLRLGSAGAEKIVREPAVGVFLETSTNKKFHLATIHLVPTAKKPENEVPHLFSTVDGLPGKYPRLIVGDFNLGSDHVAFTAAKSSSYVPAFSGAVKTSLKQKKREYSQPYDNMWGKDLTFQKAKVWDVFKQFSQFSAQTVYRDISDHAPIQATVTLN